MVVCGLFIIFSLIGFLTWSGKIFTSIGRPIWRVENTVIDSAQSIGYVARTKSSVFAENENLKKDNTNLKLSMVDCNILKKENDQLKELLGRVKPESNFIISSILTKPNRSPYDTIIIDVGSNTDIVPGLLVYAGVDVPIGEVNKVYDNDSLVMLYSNPGQITEGVLEGSNASVELVGRGGGNFEMTIPLDLSSELGAMVVLPGISTKVLAIVDAVISIPTDPVKKVLLHSPVNIQNLKWVQVKKD